MQHCRRPARARPSVAAVTARAALAALAGLAGILVAGGALAACTPAAAPAGTAGAATTLAYPTASGPTRPYRPTPAPAPTFATHVVRTGETLIGLARQFATTPESLAYWNRARYPSLDPDSPTYKPDRIEIGWELVYLPDTVVDPEHLPPASAAPTEATGSAGPASPFPTLPPDGGAAFVRRGPAGLDGVALTFEYAGGAGAGTESPEAVVQWLEVSGVPATVFVGAAAAAPGDVVGAAVLARLARAMDVTPGLLADSGDGTRTAAALDAADAALRPALGASTVPWLRPATGTASAAALRAAGTAGWRWAIGWDVDPEDGVPPAAGGPTAEDILARVVSRAGGGSIVRLQLGGAHTLDALPDIVDGLGAAGLRVVSLAELLGLPAAP